MPIPIDLTKVKGLDPVPPGDYKVVVVAAEEAVSQKGNEMFNLRFKIEGGEFDGRQIFETWTFTPESLWRVKLGLTALGFGKDFKGKLAPEDLIGHTCLAHIKIESGRGTDPKTGEAYPDRNRIDRYAALDASAKSAADLA